MDTAYQVNRVVAVAPAAMTRGKAPGREIDHIGPDATMTG